MKALSFKNLGTVQAERAIHGTAFDGQPYVARLRCWCDAVGFFEVDPHDARCSLLVGDFMVTRLHPSTWRSIVALFD